jgi:hypothetical protein
VTSRPRTHRPLAILAVCAAVLATLVPAATGYPLLGKREFQRRANAVCAGYTRRLSKIPQPKTQADLVPYLQKSVALAKAQTKDLGALKPPPAFVRKFARMQTIGRAEAAAAAQLITALQAGDQARSQTLILRITALDKQYNTAATSIGLTACAKAAPTG